MTSFKVGDRVQLNELGRSRNKRMRVQTGTVVKISAPAISSAIDVLFDGNKKPTRNHSSYFEYETPENQ